MSEKLKLLCETCLSNDRRLTVTSQILSILKEIQCEEWDRKVICWECHSLIIKFHKFKTQAKNAEIALFEKNFKILSKLTHSTKLKYDFEFIHNYESLTNDTNKGENVEKKIKEENDCDDKEELIITYHSDHENDTKLSIVDRPDESKEETKEMAKKIKSPPKQMSNEKLHKKESFQKLLAQKNTEDKTSKKKEKLTNFSLEESSALLKEKFETVLLSEEEMLRSREEKRSHPNYKKIPYKCETCVLGFTKKDNYDLHLAKKHREVIGPHVCTVCATRFESASSLARHCTLHYVHYRCSLCSYKTTQMTAAVTHCRLKHARDERDRIHCKQCSAVFRTLEELAEHTKSEHILYCKDCGEKFKGKHTLRAHRVRIHAVKREFVCEVCKRSFLTKSRLESHVVQHSPTLARQLSYCALCDVQYKNIQVYRSHMQNNVNHAQNRYQCPECNKKFASKIYRTKHYNFYHLKKSQHKCESCNKLFISEWRLKNHRQKHHGLARTRDHECKECGKKFYTCTSLSVHVSTHSAARAHLCASCGAQYRQPAALYAHERRAHRTRAPDSGVCTEEKGIERT